MKDNFPLASPTTGPARSTEPADPPRVGRTGGRAPVSRSPDPETDPVAFLDALTAAVTAFRTWAEFRASLAGGYYPTIYGRTRRERILRRVVVAHGFNVYPPSPR